MKRLVVCLFVLASCGGSDAIEVDDLGPALAGATCERQFSCCTDPEIVEQYMGITFDGRPIETEADCVEFATAVFVGFAVTAYKESIAKGRMEYDAGAAGDCVAAIEALTCAQYGAEEFPERGCRPYLIPKVTNGGGCTEDYECTSGNCSGESTPLGGPATDGACAPMPGEGEECDDNCAGDLVCDSQDNSGVETCMPARANGTPCNVDSECESDFCDQAADACAEKPATCDGR